jgi:hypothetical protein
MKKHILLATVAAFALSTPAFAETQSYDASTKVEKKDNGDYSEKTKASETDAAGVKTTSEKKVDVDVDSKGDTKTTVKTKETSKDKGLFKKKHSTKTKDTQTTKDGAVTKSTHKKVVDGKTVENETSK